ncbi:MBL fold metallo-hydrolase [Chryseolinea sp. T2]|uniref:MBL fold metallo-hydrolase n=1 Tax=Chryseolinea sp. T2 TaxID=3129255 RepID=UPI0030785ABD
MKQMLLGLMLLPIVSHAQLPSPDKVEAGSGPISIQPITHGSLVLTWNNVTIYIDPYGGGQLYNGIARPDLILITDIHGDHLNPETLSAIDVDHAAIVAPQAVVDQLAPNLKDKATVLANGSSISKSGIDIQAIPMYNIPDDKDARHSKGRGNGYVLTLGGKRIYISGDTEDIPEMRGLKNIDVAFVCMNLPYTMDINQAASAVLEFKPKIVYPYHYRGQGGLADVEGFKKLVNKGSKSIDVRLRNWYSGG